MSYNEGAVIVPIETLAEYIGKVAPFSVTPENYERVQLLKRPALHELVFDAHDRRYIIYGADSADFPLCEDFADVCYGDVKRESIRAGLAVRPAFGLLEYTMNAIDPKTYQNMRHAINWAVYEDGSIEFFEPQTDSWMSRPNDCKSMDNFRL